MKRFLAQIEFVQPGSATRAPVDVNHPTGEDWLNADECHARPDPRAEHDPMECDEGDGGFSQPGQESGSSCPGCGNSPGKGVKFSLSGPNKGELRDFVQEKRKRFLERMGISFSPENACVSLEQMSICSTCQRQYYKAAQKKSGDCQSSCPQSGTIELTIPRMANTQAKCVFGHYSSERLSVPLAVRTKILVTHRIYVPPDARCCRLHLESGEWDKLSSALRSYNSTKSRTWWTFYAAKNVHHSSILRT
jgi:hypothetical protein